MSRLSIFLTLSILLLATSAVAQQGIIIASVEAQSGPATELRITGQGFGATQGDKDSVWIGGREAVVKSWSDNAIVALVPKGAANRQIAVFRGSRKLAEYQLPVALSTAPATPVKPNGILVNGIKVYDDQALQQALNSARAQLAAIQVINQSAIAGQIGSLQGATLSQFALSANIGSLPTAGVQTTANTGNTSTTSSQGLNNQLNSGNSVNTASNATNNQTTTGGTTTNTAVTTNGSNVIAANTSAGTQSTTGSTTSSQSQNTTSGSNTLVVTGPSTVLTNTTADQTQVIGPSTTTVTTQAPFTPVAPTVSPSALALPTSYSPGASSVLNEQLELTNEITGYELLLEGSLSDHFVQYMASGSPAQAIRPRTTIGVPITISPSKSDEDAVAVIELEVTSSGTLGDRSEPPEVTAILPRDKTYNVATITDKSFSIGGAVATQVISLGVSALWGHKAYFVVQDQDTVALQMPRQAGDQPKSTRFGWQIRPVLGQQAVTAGMRNCFVQLAFAEQPNVPVYGTVHITTRWKKYDRKRGIVLDEDVPGSVQEVDQSFDIPIPRFNLHPPVDEASYEDNGDGTLTVAVKGNYLSGTFAKVGPLTFVPGVNGTVQDPSEMRFSLPATQLATHNGYVVNRSGDTTEIVQVLVQGVRDRCVNVSDIGAVPAGAGMTRVTVKVDLVNKEACIQKDNKPYTKISDLVVVAGNQVFGLRNAPFLSVSDSELTFLIPTGVLRANRRVIIKRLLWGEAFEVGATLDDKHFQNTPVVSQATVVSQTKTTLVLALIGTGLTGLQPLLPGSAVLSSQQDYGAVLTVPATDVKDLKQMVLKDGAGELFLVNLPAPPAASQPPTLDTIEKGQATISVPAGDQNFDALTGVSFEGKRLSITVAADRKSVMIEAKPLTATAGTKELIFSFNGEKTVRYSVTVVDLKVDTLRPAAQTPK